MCRFQCINVFSVIVLTDARGLPTILDTSVLAMKIHMLDTGRLIFFNVKFSIKP